MKLAIGFLSVYTAAAFTALPAFKTRDSALFATRPDTSSMIDAALAASKKFGATSKEARVAWDAVEEMDASDNSAASLGSLDTECLVEEEVSKACLEYSEKLEELSSILAEQSQKMGRVKGLAEEISAIKLKVKNSQPGNDSPALQEALASARAASEKFGAKSAEAKVAWEAVEDIASGGLDNAMGVRLDEECLVESAMEACQALEELNRALNQQQE